MPFGPEGLTLPGVRVKRLESHGLVEAVIEAAPSSTRDDLGGQFSSLANNARQALVALGLAPTNLVAGWIHFAENPPWDWRKALASAWEITAPLPLTALLQRPAQPFCRCSMQLHVMRTARQNGVWYGNTERPAAATVLRAGARHLRLMSVLPRPEVRGNDIADLAYDMFAQAHHALTDRGLSFSDVVRTWIYVPAIQGSAAGWNEALRRFLRERGIERLPAITCVEGALVGAASPVAMDLYALGEHPEVRVVPDASSADVARATTVIEPDRQTLYLSGMAGIDEQSNLVAAGDLQGQLDGMFRNVRSLLDRAALGFADVIAAKAYLKKPAAYAPFCEAARAYGLADDVPKTVVVTDLRRADMLCEIELWAVRVM